MARIVGIDFGTTNSVIAAIEGGEPVVIPNSRGERLTPSAVSFQDDGEILIGELAKKQAVIRHDSTFLSVKRLIGLKEKLEAGGRMFSPQQLAALILKKLKEDAEDYLGEMATEAVITTPAYFNDAQRQGIREAGELAGFQVKRLINEPTAAALAYGMPRAGSGIVMAFDLGGGTFDVSILDISENLYEALATRGDNQLGGDDFDRRVADWICNRFAQLEKVDLRRDPMACQKVLEAAETAKKELSEREKAHVAVPFIASGKHGPKHLDIKIARADFEKLIAPDLERIDEIVQLTLEDAGLSDNDVKAVVLVGGSTRIPIIRRKLESRFHGRVFRNISPDESVALGAAIQGNILSGGAKGLVLVDVTPLALGIAAENDLFVPIIERNSAIPATRSRAFTTVADYQTSVEVQVYQGERAKASLNMPIGKFTLSGFRPAPKGEVRIEVRFSIDVDGLLHVSAIDAETGLFEELKVDSRSKRPSSEAIDGLLDQAREHRQEDRRFEKKMQLSKALRSLIEQLKLRENIAGARMSQSDLARLTAMVEKALKSQSPGEMDEALYALQACMKEGGRAQ